MAASALAWATVVPAGVIVRLWVTGPIGGPPASASPPAPPTGTRPVTRTRPTAATIRTPLRAPIPTRPPTEWDMAAAPSLVAADTDLRRRCRGRATLEGASGG